LAGISFDHRMTEDTGSSVADVARAFLAARSIVGSEVLWVEIDAIGELVPFGTQLDLFLDARRMAERAAGWILRHRPPSFDVRATIDAFGPGISRIERSLDDFASGRVGARIAQRRADRIAAGVPVGLAARSALWPWMHPAFDIIDVAVQEQCPIERVATAYWEIFEAFDLLWLWDGIGALPRSDRWQTQARSALRDDLLSVLASLARNVVRTADGSPADWIATNQRSVGKALAMHTEIRRAESFDLTTLSVALRQLRNLTLVAR
jgi:glutamate dehydrogenase